MKILKAIYPKNIKRNIEIYYENNKDMCFYYGHSNTIYHYSPEGNRIAVFRIKFKK